MKNIFSNIRKAMMAVSLFAMGGAILTSCNEDEIPTFETDDAGIYFQDGGQTRFYINIDAYNDSTTYSFSEAADEVMDKVLYARIRTLGKVRDYDRKVKVVVDTENSTAIEGKHFVVDFDTVCIKAGQSEAMVGVKFLRDASLKEEQVRLVIKVEDNENFKVPFDSQKNTNVYYDEGKIIRANSYVFEVNEFYSEPMLWMMFGEESVGEWSITKQRLMTKMFELSAYDWSIEGWQYGDGKIQSKTFDFFAVKMRIYLQNMANAGTPVMDDDGKYMQLGDYYHVDYSAYNQ